MPTLEVRGLTKKFPAVLALDGVDLEFAPGEVHGVIGENGAGKSTLMKILSGVQPPTSGEIWLDGKPIRLHGVGDALSHGIAMIHQELNLVDELTAAENIFLGREKTSMGILERGPMQTAADGFLREVGAAFPSSTPVGDLSIAGKQLVEIAKALSYDASILIMDEPTAVLSEPESEALFKLIASLKERGVTVLYISHRLVEVCEICDRISVLRDGKKVTMIPGPGSQPSELASLMVGRPLSDFFPPKAPESSAEPIFEARDVVVDRWVKGVSITVRPGEIVGLAGLVGAGRTEFCEALIGARPMRSGKIFVDGKQVNIRSPRDAKEHGIAYVSEDRKGLGLILSLPVVDNTTLANLESYSSVVVNRPKQVASTQKWKSDLDIRAGDLNAAVLFLSGGNQQKVSIAKWLETKPRVLILDEPTRGVDVGAKREMYELIQKLAEQGLACIVVSSELAEIIGLCHRAVVLREGEAMGEVRGNDLNEETMMALAAGVENE